MAIQKEKTYMVLNYSANPVSISTKDRSIIFEGGSPEAPYGIPMTANEIIAANMNGCAFKIGLLWFEPDVEEDMYTELRILNWKNILKDQEIESIIMHPSADGYEKILSIDNPMYFDRVVGVLLGLKNSFEDVPNQSKVLIDARAAEIREGKRRTEIKISKIATAPSDMEKQLSEKDAQIAALEAEIADLKEKAKAHAKVKESDVPASSEPADKPKRTSTKK